MLVADWFETWPTIQCVKIFKNMVNFINLITYRVQPTGYPQHHPSSEFSRSCCLWCLRMDPWYLRHWWMCTFCHEKFLHAFFEMIDKYISQKFHTIWLYIYSSIKRLVFSRLMEDGGDLILRSVKSLKQRPSMILHLCSVYTHVHNGEGVLEFFNIEWMKEDKI